MAHKKGQGTSRNGRDSNAQRLGFKAFGGQLVPGGTIIVRQRGTRVKPGLNVGRGKDDTLFAKITGRIKFKDRGSMGKFVMIVRMRAFPSGTVGNAIPVPITPSLNSSREKSIVSWPSPMIMGVIGVSLAGVVRPPMSNPSSPSCGLFRNGSV